MERKEAESDSFKITLLLILGVVALTICVCLIYTTFFKDRPATGTASSHTSSMAESAPTPAEENLLSGAVPEQRYQYFAWQAKKSRDFILPLDTNSDGLNYSGINSVELTADGTATLHCTEELGEAYGVDYEVQTGVLAVFPCHYGLENTGIIFFVLENGSITALNPDDLIQQHQIKLITDFGDIQHVTKIERMDDGYYNELICATDIDGKITPLDQYLL